MLMVVNKKAKNRIYVVCLGLFITKFKLKRKDHILRGGFEFKKYISLIMN